MTAVLFTLAGLVAIGDWIAVARGRSALEALAKPLVLILLLIAVASADLGRAKPEIVLGLGLGLIGDIALLFSDSEDTSDPADAAFVTGLAAFLAGHVAYAVAFLRAGVSQWQLLAGILVVAGTSALVSPRILRAARRAGGDGLAGTVAVYSTVLAVMAALAVGTGAVATAIGGVLFVLSDATLAWDRFHQRLLRGPVIVAVTYHLAQFLIVLGLLR